MLISSILTRNATENFKKERYGSNGKHVYAIMIASIVILIIEIAMLYFAVRIALASGTTDATKFIHVVLAIFFTFPYLLLNMIFNKNVAADLEA